MIRRPAVDSAALTDLVTAQVLGITVAAVGAAVGIGAVAACGLGALTVAVTLARVGGRTVPHWIMLRANRTVESTPRRTVLTIPGDTGDSGVVWDGARLSVGAELTVRGARGWTTIGASGTTPDTAIPVRDVLEALRVRADAPITVDICTHGHRPRAGRRAADAYAQLAGPLAGVATRRTWVVLSTDTTDVAAAARRRGGGLNGAVATLRTRLDRLEVAMTRAGVVVTRLPADGFRHLDLAPTGGYPSGHGTESWRHLDVAGHRWTSWFVAARHLNGETVDRIWAAPAASTVTSVRLVPSGDSARMSVVWAHEDSAPIEVRAVPRSVSFAGRRRASFGAFLPSLVASTSVPLDPRPVSSGTLARLSMPIAGCGQLVGADSEGAAVAVRVFGPEVRVVDVSGELYLAQQVVFRSVAIGGRVLVLTDRAQRWHRVAQATSDSGLLGIAPASAAPDRARPPDLLVVDHGGSRLPDPRCTTMFLARPDRSDPAVPDADIRIEQPGAFGDHIELTVGGQFIPLTLVTTGAESMALGRPEPGPTRGRTSASGQPG